MTALSITAGNVIAGTNAKKQPVTFGAAVTAGQALYRDATTGKYLPADADSAVAAAHRVAGISLCGGADGQPGFMQTSGDITIGATLVVGQTYVLDTGAGGICPISDLAAGEYVAVIGTARTASVLQMAINNTGVQVPA